MARWDPWEALRRRPHIELLWGELDGHEGLWQRDSLGEVVVLDVALSRRRRRCVLAHELIHAERGIGHGAASEATMEREEETVRRETARRLVPPVELRAFLRRRSGVGPVGVEDVCEEFDVDPDVAAKAVALLDLATTSPYLDPARGNGSDARRASRSAAPHPGRDREAPP